MIELLKRSLSGIVFVAVPIFSLYSGPLYFLVFIALCSILSVYEYNKLSNYGGYAGGKLLLLFTPVFWIAVIFEHLDLVTGGVLIGTLIMASGITLAYTLLSKSDNVAGDVQTVLFGIIYTQISFYSMYLFGSRGAEFNPDIILFVFLLIWINDSFAYLSGKSFGKTKLKPSLSPGKTWEGTGVGAVFALGSAFLLSTFVFEFEGAVWIFVGIIATVFATLGDLFESALKRRAGAKDSGKLIPGHGGVLDRFDAALFAFPSCWAFIELFEGVI